MDEERGPRRPVVTLQTAFTLIEVLKEHGVLSLDELARELPFAKSTVHRHVETLVAEGYVLRESGKYQSSLRFLDVGIQARDCDELFSIARDRVDELAIDTGEKVWCIVEENGKAVPIYGNSGKNSIQSNISIGEHSLLHQLAAGKAILAHLPQARIDKIVETHGLPSETEHTISNREALRTELQKIRENGVAFNHEESGHRLHAVGAPIRDDDNVAIGSLSVSGSKRRLQGEFFSEDLPDRLLKLANDIEVDLLYS